MGSWQFGSLVMLLASCVSFPLHAAKFVLKPSADTSLVEASPTNNFGKSPRLRVGGDGLGRNRALIEFDLSSIPSTSKVVAASLKLIIPPGEIGGTRGPTWLFRTLRDWNEGTKEGESGQPAAPHEAAWLHPGTPASPWSEPGGRWLSDFSFERISEASITGYSLPAFVRFDGPGLARDLQAWRDQPESNFGWFFYASTDPTTNQFGQTCDCLISFASREDPENAPELTVFTGNPDAPRAFMDGDYVEGTQAGVDPHGLRELRLESPYPNGHVFFTIDGSRPTLISPRYERPLSVGPGFVLRAVTYSSDYSVAGVELNLTFVTFPSYSFNILQVGNGSVSFLPLPSTFPVRYPSNTLVRVVATPAPGWTFTGWTGTLQSPDPNLSFNITQYTDITAHFAPEGFSLTTRRIQSDFILVQFDALSTQDYYVQSSPDLQTWATVQTVVNKTGKVDAIFPLEYAAARGTFYRVVSAPKGTTPPY